MTRMQRFDWFARLIGRPRLRHLKTVEKLSHSRRLTFQELEDRRMLALVTVINDLNLVNGNVGTAETITFDAAFDGATDAPVIVDVEAAIVRTPSSTDGVGQVETLPADEVWIHEWDVFWLEIFAQVRDTEIVGIETLSADVNYNSDYFTATSVTPGFAFTDGLSIDINDSAGTVHVEGNRTIASLVGAELYVLLARIRFEPTGSDPGVPIELDEPKSVAPVGDVWMALSDADATVLAGTPISAVEIGPAPATDLYPLLYDLDDDNKIGFGDLAHFAAFFLANVDDVSAAAKADFDASGTVNFTDFSFFAFNFLKNRTASDSIQFPDSFPVDFSTIRLIIFAGQSNIGMSAQAPEAIFVPEVLHQYNTNNHLTTDWVPLETVGPNNIHASDITFAQKISEELEQFNFATLKFARSGTSLSKDWDPDQVGLLYDQFVDFTNGAISQLEDEWQKVEVAAFVWIQGSGDAGGLTKAQAYGDNLADLAAAVRSEFGEPELPIIINEFHIDSVRTFTDELRESQAEFIEADPNAYMINIDDLSLRDAVHWEQPTHIEAGYRFADVFLSLEPQAIVVEAAGSPQAEAVRLADDQTGAILREAATRLAVSADAVTVEVVDLPGDLLGRTSAGTIQLDVDAAGYGWFIDTTPGNDREFSLQLSPTEFAAPVDSAAAGHVDLLTVVMHELGHVLGHGHDSTGSVMDSSLPLGRRRLAVDIADYNHDDAIKTALVDEIFANLDR